MASMAEITLRARHNQSQLGMARMHDAKLKASSNVELSTSVSQKEERGELVDNRQSKDKQSIITVVADKRAPKWSTTRAKAKDSVATLELEPESKALLNWWCLLPSILVLLLLSSGLVAYATFKQASNPDNFSPIDRINLANYLACRPNQVKDFEKCFDSEGSFVSFGSTTAAFSSLSISGRRKYRSAETLQLSSPEQYNTNKSLIKVSQNMTFDYATKYVCMTGLSQFNSFGKGGGGGDWGDFDDLSQSEGYEETGKSFSIYADEKCKKDVDGMYTTTRFMIAYESDRSCYTSQPFAGPNPTYQEMYEVLQADRIIKVKAMGVRKLSSDMKSWVKEFSKANRDHDENFTFPFDDQESTAGLEVLLMFTALQDFEILAKKSVMGDLFCATQSNSAILNGSTDIEMTMYKVCGAATDGVPQGMVVNPIGMFTRGNNKKSDD